MDDWGGDEICVVTLTIILTFPRNPNSQQTSLFQRITGTVWEKSLQICGAGREWRKINKKAHAGRGPETKWEMSDQ
jgi:hypothetical protein